MAEYSAVSFKIEADNKPALSAIGEIKTALKDLKVDCKIKVPQRPSMNLILKSISIEFKTRRKRIRI